jgi:fibronectin-binding autotransporter adhesin
MKITPTAHRWRAWLVCLSLGLPLLRAQTTVYWDTNGATAGAGTSPSATWSTAGADKNWSTSSAGTAATAKWVNGRIAVFSAGTDATGSYTVTVSGTVSTAGITVEEGDPTFSGGKITLSGSTPQISVNAGSTLTFNSQLSGTAGFTKSGSGILTLGSTANAYTGATTVNAGTLLLGASNVITDTSALVIASGAMVDLGWGHSETVASLAGAGTLDIKGGPFTVGNATNTTFSGVLTDSGGYGTVVKQGTGTLTLSGANTYTGPTTINAGALNLQNSSALGTSTYGNTVASGAALQLQNNITVTEGAFAIAGSGVGSTGVIRNISGNNTLDAALTLNASSTLGSDAGTLGLTGDLSLGSGQTLTATGAGNIDLSGAITGSGNLTQAGAGMLTLSGTTANSFNGATAINNGTLQLNKTAGTNALAGGAVTIGDSLGAANSASLTLLASNQIADYGGLITINSDGRLNLNSQQETINTVAGTGSIAFGSGGYLGVGVNSGSSTFGGSLTGTGVLEKLGSGSLTFASSFNFSGELRLTGGTVILAGISATVTTLHITGNTVLDFGNSTASTLNATTLLVDAGVTLTITNWINTTDYFYAQNWTGATLGTTGTTPMNQITFSGFSNNSTQWQSYDHAVTPVPEPAVYGTIFAGLGLAAACWRRRSPPSSALASHA